MILSLNSIKKSFGVNEVLRDVGFIANEGERVALIGANGAGKTTLFRIITGEMAADSGEIAIKKGAKIGYLSQVSELDFKKTIYEELISTFDYLIKLESDIRRLEQRMEKEHSEAIMQRYASLISEFESKNGYEYQSRTRGIMTGLGFEEAEFDLSIGLLSGGQKTRVALAKLLLSDPDLLLLDEPTNHLDIASISWLENYFTQDFKKSLVIISHDRYFMDKVVDKVVEIEHGKSLMYSGNYSQFIEKKMADLDSQIHRYESQQKEIARQEKSIALLLSFNREKSVRRARSKQKQLAKVERVEKPKNAPDSMRLELKPKRQSGNDVLTARDIEKSFGNRQLFRNVDMDIKKGETVALIGANGIGKTTLFGIILEKSLGVSLGANVRIGYYDQALSQLDPNVTIFDEIANSYPRLTNLEIRNALAAFVFIGDDVFDKISTLSGGERGRVSLAKLMLDDVNFLLLDEPTNHLDLPSKQILESALNSYTGTILYISHDRYFINNTADKIYELTPQGAVLYLGDYDYYLEKSAELQAEKSGGIVKNADTRNAAANTENKDIVAANEIWSRNKAKQSEERRRKSALTRLENQIADIESELIKLDNLSTEPEIYLNPAEIKRIQDEKSSMNEKLSMLYEEWEELGNLI